MTDAPAGYTPFPPDDFPGDSGLHGQLAPLFVNWQTDAPPSMGLRVCASHLNGMGICHGAVYMAMLDFALATAIAFKRDRLAGTPTVNIDIDYMQSAKKDDWIYTTANCTRVTNTLGFAQGSVMGKEGLLASGKGIFKLPKDLSEGKSYQEVVKRLYTK